jgi:hypothetical protein
MDIYTRLEKIFSGTEGEESLIAQCNKIAETKTEDVQQVASILQKMIVSYYQDVRRQARMAFLGAFGLEIIAVCFFLRSASITMKDGSSYTGTATISAVSGLLIQVMTAVVFYLYAQSARQFGGFHICLERTNRFLLANSMAEQLPEAERTSKRAEVITAVLNAPMLTLAMIESGTATSDKSSS